VRGGGGGPPVPDAVAVGLGVGLFAVLEGVVDDHRVGGAGGEGAADSDCVHAAGSACELELVLCGDVVAEPDVEGVGVGGDLVADEAAHAAGDGGRV
jgi:hypothetical protein